MLSSEKKCDRRFILLCLLVPPLLICAILYYVSCEKKITDIIPKPRLGGMLKRNQSGSYVIFRPKSKAFVPFFNSKYNDIPFRGKHKNERYWSLLMLKTFLSWVSRSENGRRVSLCP